MIFEKIIQQEIKSQAVLSLILESEELKKKEKILKKETIQFDVFECIKSHPGITINAASRMLKLKISSIHAAVRRLYNAQLISKEMIDECNHFYARGRY
jgi:DNA-binding MarR family transcriptional regulator